MKTSFHIAISLGLALFLAAVPPAQAATGFTVLRVCQDDLVLHTSDKADAGHISHVVIDTSSRAVVSVLITGGVIAERTVVVPFTSVQLSEQSATLVEIDRERLVSAPVIERSSITRTSFDASWIERSRTHFTSGTRATTERREGERRDEPAGRTSDRPRDRTGETRPSDRTPESDSRRPDRTKKPEAESRKSEARPDSSQPPSERPDPSDKPGKSGDKTGKSDAEAGKKGARQDEDPASRRGPDASRKQTAEEAPSKPEQDETPQRPADPPSAEGKTKKSQPKEPSEPNRRPSPPEGESKQPAVPLPKPEAPPSPNPPTQL